MRKKRLFFYFFFNHEYKEMSTPRVTEDVV